MGGGGATYTKYTSNFTEGLEDLELDDPIEPMPPNPANQVAFKIWKLDIKEYHARMQEYSFRLGLYILVLRQCTQSMQEQLKSHQDFPGANQDGITLHCHHQVTCTFL